MKSLVPIKNAILRIGQSLIEIAVVFGIIASVLMGILQAFESSNVGTLGKLIVFVLSSVIGIAVVIIGAFLSFLLIDIRDELKKMNTAASNNNSTPKDA